MSDLLTMNSAECANHIVASIRPEDHLGLVYSVAFKFVRDNTPVEESDAYQDGCLGLMKAVKTFKPERGFAFSTWATQVIRHSIIDAHKRRKNRIICESVEDISSIADPIEEHEPFSLDQFTCSDSSDSETDIEDRRILLNHYLDGKNYAEISRELSVSREYVRQRANRALRKIQERMGVNNGK